MLKNNNTTKDVFWRENIGFLFTNIKKKTTNECVSPLTE